VRVHRVLDQDKVPAWFVRYVLFHELLHAALEEPRRAGRRVLHGPRFRERERQYADFERAKRWELSHLDELIRAARNPKLVRQAPAKAARSVVGWAQELLFR